MLKLYNSNLADNSAYNEAQKSATNLTGSINTLSNSWTEFINTIINSDGLKTVVNLLNDIVQGATDLVDTFGVLGTLGTTIGAFKGQKLGYASI